MMRLRVLETGHRPLKKLILSLIRRYVGEVPGPVLTLSYRRESFGRHFAACLHEGMRGAKEWRLGEVETAPIGERLRAMLGFLEKLTLTPDEVGAGDIAVLRRAGLTDRAIREAIYVCFLFSVMDRLADAFDFTIPSAKSQDRAARFLYRLGYAGASVPG